MESDPTLDVWSAVRYPKRNADYCLIAYHPDRARYLDYLVAHECAHVYRFFLARPEERVVPAANTEGLNKGIQQVSRESWDDKRLIPHYKMNEFVTALCVGLFRQLVNTPADCRIEAWLHRTFKELRDVQASALLELYPIAAEGLKPELQKWLPPFVYDRSNTLNYVMTKHVGRLLEMPELVDPYVAAGYRKSGDWLDSHLDGEDTGYVGDVRTADVWGKEMGIRDWFEWAELG